MGVILQNMNQNGNRLEMIEEKEKSRITDVLDSSELLVLFLKMELKQVNTLYISLYNENQKDNVE